MIDKTTQNRIVGIILGILAACLIYGFFSGLRGNFGILSSMLVQQIPGATYGNISTIFFVFSLINAFLIPVLGYISAKVSKTFILLLGCISLAISLGGICLSGTLVSLAIFVDFFLAVGCAAISYGVVFSILAPALGKKVAAIATGLLTCSATFFSSILGPATIIISSAFSFTACIILFMIIAILCIPLSLYLSHKKEIVTEPKEEKEKLSVRTTLHHLLSSPLFYVGIAGFTFYGFCSQGITNHLYTGLTSEGFSGFAGSLTISGINLFMTAGAVGIGFLAAKFRKHIRIFISLFSALVILEIILYLSIDVPVLFIITLNLFGLLSGALLPLLTIIMNDSFSPLYLATLLGILNFFKKLGQAINFQIGGIIYDLFSDLTSMCLIQALIAVFILIIAIMLLTIHLKKSATEELTDND